MTDEASYVLVPREPTEAMLDAGYAWTALSVEDTHSSREEMRSAWTAMLAASPVTGDVDREAVARVEQYVRMRREKPLRLTNDSIHAVHTGTEWEAELRLSDLEIVLALVRGEG